MNSIPVQGELFGLFWQKPDPLRLHVNDMVRIDGRFGRVNDCAAVVLLHRPARQFVTRFNKHVRFKQAPVIIRISVRSETEVLNRPPNGKRRRSAPPRTR